MNSYTVQELLEQFHRIKTQLDNLYSSLKWEKSLFLYGTPFNTDDVNCMIESKIRKLELSLQNIKNKLSNITIELED